MMRRWGVVAVAMLAIATAAEAQEPGEGFLAVGGHVGSLRYTKIDAAAATSDVVSGPAIGGMLRLRVWRVELTGRYLQSALSGAVSEDFVEGELGLGIRVVRWLSVRAGPRVRAHVTENGTERWVFWEGRVRGDARLLGPGVRTYVEGWASFGGDVNLALPLQRAGGVEGGLMLKVPVSQLWLVASYRFDRAALTGAAQVESSDQLMLALTFGGF